ncbi:hypothetical protein J3R82DRAFT_5967 [Butyriboletus roseoflavus]|nr:hypothetical protein J3R82DRAFT_5967 [Butyriboletus roseoflavus]
MNSHSTRRRDDRSVADPFKPWVPPDKHPPDNDPDRRRNRSATVPAHSYDPRPYPSHDTRNNDPRQSSRSHRQDNPSAAPYSSYHHSSTQVPSTSRAYQHATRPSAQYSSSGYHYPQPSSYQPSHTTPAYPPAGSSRKPHPEPSDPRPLRRPVPPTHQSAYDQVSSGEEMARASRHPARHVHSSTQPPLSAPTNQAYWNPPQETSSSRRHKDSYRDRDRDQDREKERERERERERKKEREKPTAEIEDRYKDRARAERHRERERERAIEVRYQDPSRSRHHDRRKDSDTEAVLYSDQRNASKASLSGREGHPASARESGNGHRRHRTEDGTVSTGRRHPPENTQNPITAMPSQSTSMPQPDVQQAGEPPPAPRVMPVYLPPKAKSQRSHREGRSSTAQGAQSGSDTERATGKHRMDRTPSGPAVQRSDGHASSSTRDRGNHDLPIGPRDDVKRLEGKYGVHQDTRQPLAPLNVDIPLVTPGINASALPTETRASNVPQIVSIRAGQGPSDPHDAHFKSSAILHSDAPQDIIIHPPQPTAASIVKSSSQARAQSDRPVVVEHSRTEPRGDDLPPGQRMSTHESSRALPNPISKPSYSRGNPETGVEIASSSYSHSRPPSRSAHRTSANNVVPPAVVGPRPLRSVSQGPQTNEPPTRPPSVAQYVPTISSLPNQYSVPPSPAHPTNGSPPKAGHTHGSLSSTQPSPKTTQLHGVSPSHSTSIKQVPSAPPSVHPTPIIAPQTLTASSRPSTRDGAYTDAPHAHQHSADRQPPTDTRPVLRQTSDNTTVKASWVVQTPVTAKRAKISREDKYLGDHHFDSEMPHAQLRQVLSQDGDSFPRASSSMMKASQAITPATSSQRNSPGAKTKDVPFGTPRGTLASNSPRSRSTKEATPEHLPRQNLPHLSGPPQIAVVGATPVTMARDLPQGRVDHALLAPPFPAPTRTSRTTSSSRDQPSQPPQPAVQNTSSTSHQPQLAPAVHAPSLFQSYRPPSLPVPGDDGQLSPPPLPIPPPRGPEDSPPPPIESRSSEIIPTRSQSDGHPQSYVHSFPEVQSEMFHIPTQPSAPPQLSSTPPPRATQPWPPSKLDSNTVPTSTSNGSVAGAHADARFSEPAVAQPDDVQVAHQEIMGPIPVLPSQLSTPATRARLKVTIEDEPEDSPMLSKAIPMSVPTISSSVPVSRPVQPPQNTTIANVNPTSKSAAVDQSGHKSLPHSRSKDLSFHRGAESSTMPATPPMPPPTSAAPTSTRMPSSAPPAQPTFFPIAQGTPPQRATSHIVSSRTYQRTAEMSQPSKSSTSAGTNPVATGSVNKSTPAPVQTTYNPANAVGGQHQLVNGTNAQGFLASRAANPSTTTVPHPSTSATASMTKAAAHTTTTGSGPPVGGLGLHIYAPSTSITTKPPSAPDPLRQQPNRSGAFLIPSLDTTSTTVMTTAAAKNAHQEQPIIDSTRPRDVTSSATRNLPPSSHIYPTSARPGTSSAMTQHTHVTPTQPSTHHRVVSLPITQPSSAVQKPPSPRKYSQPISSTTVSTQPFPSRPPAPEPQSARAPASGHVFTPAPVRSARLPPLDRTNDSDMLNTPSSIAPSPMLNPDTSNGVPQSTAVPIRARQSSTDSKDDKKKPSGLFGLFRARTLSSKAADPPVVSTVTRASPDEGKVHPDASATGFTAVPAPRGMTLTSVLKESNSAPPPATTASTRAASQSKIKGRILDPIAVPPPPMQVAREHKDPTPHIFTPFKFLTMHSKRNRTVSAASLDVCDGNTATNTVIGSPDHSTVSQVQPLPPIIPPGIRDPLIATSEWRDREEAERRERRTHRIRRPGVTFDVEEEPPSPAPGAMKRKKLIRRPSGRAATPGPPRG